MTVRSSFPDLLSDRLATYEPLRVEAAEGTTRAAVILLLRPSDDGAEALFVVRAEHPTDPWSGHVALPGGRMDPGDPDLVHTALRELREETGLRLKRPDIVGRLDELHPTSRHIPRIAITPFVGWQSRGGTVRRTVEIDGHFWAPLAELRAPSRRSSLVLEREGDSFRFPTIEYAGYTVWGLTYSIVRNFLDLIAVGDERQ
ncbi:MAG: CoA pyrophosphatase [Gemmatimonadota bacterium]|jgi:8-oxo-dGTP pyrophosphatase MutT (NUDIX family)|nr:MAG: CoA pyrophosphatase [Gemmatimonadota bacterium]